MNGGTTEGRGLELTLDRVVAREMSRLAAQQRRLRAQLTEFERRYSLSSRDFYARFERGEMGDDTDFVEWSATHEMLENLDTRLDILRGGRNS